MKEMKVIQFLGSTTRYADEGCLVADSFKKMLSQRGFAVKTYGK